MRTICSCIALFFIFPSIVLAQAQLLYTFTGTNNSDRLGEGIACLGAFSTSSTTSDFALGEPGFGTTLGRLRVFSGQDGSSVLFTQNGSFSGHQVGTHLEPAGDINKDGRDDFFRGGGGSAASPNAEVIFSPDGTGGINFIPPSPSGQHGFGNASAPLMDDADGDGRTDMIIGAPTFDFGSTTVDIGHVGVYSGLNGNVITAVNGSTNGQQLGFAVASINDLSGDGKRDIVAGSPHDNSDTGKVEVFRSVGTGSPLPMLAGANVGDLFGFSISIVGDLNNDGIDELIIGAPGANGARGNAKVFNGATFNVLCSVDGVAPNDELGTTVRGVGDQNGDGRPDFAIAAVGMNSDNGRVTIYSFTPGNSTCVPLSHFDGTTQNQRYGFRIAGSYLPGKCDFNGDGFNDFAIVSPTDSMDAQKGWADFYAQFTPTPTPTNTGTSTPIQSATPTLAVTPTQTPTSTPNLTPVPELPRTARLTYKITRNGNLAALSTLNSSPAGRCVITLLGRRSRSDFSQRGKIIELGSKLATRQTTFKAAGLPKVNMCTDGKAYLFHMITKNECEGRKAFYSNTFARRLTCGVNPPVSVTKWESVLQTKID